MKFIRAIYRIAIGYLRQHPYLRHAIYIWLATALIAITIESWGYGMDEQLFYHNCVSSAIRDALTWEIRTGRKSRIAITKIDEKLNKDHAQAEGELPDGTYVPLSTHNSDGKLRSWKRHFKGEPYRYLSVDEFYEEQKAVRRDGEK